MQTQTGLEIAVIGMAGRFPKSRNIDELWNNLKNGKEVICFFSDEEMKEEGVSPELLSNPNYVKAAGILEEIECFDAFFFGYTPREAEIMDPQSRIFHECVWHALEDAGYDPGTYEGLIGLYAGATFNTGWLARAVLSGKDAQIGQFTSQQLIQNDYLTLRISYALNLKGPSFSLSTACSTSLVAIHVACQAILSGECDIAISGGVTIHSNMKKRGYMYQEGMILSPDGRCRVFDARGRGIVGSEGTGAVVLKRLEDSLLDRDHIYAVIKGSAINNDGIRKAGFAAASVEGEAEVIKIAMQAAEVEPESISYIETHGTGTELGDPVEIEGLKLAFNTNKKGFCAVGAVKSNLGHTDSASGVVGFIKTVLALKHRLIPPTLHFETPNPIIDFIDSPFYVNTGLSGWENGKYPLRAGVSSFGIGGTNAHVVLEEAPLPGTHAPGGYQLIILSAKTQTALDKMKENLSSYLEGHPGVNMRDAAYTLQVGRKELNCRWMAVCSTMEETIQALDVSAPENTHILRPEQGNAPLIKIEPPADRQALAGIGRLWLKGNKIDWSMLYPGEKPYRISIPAYPFERQKYWIHDDALKEKTGNLLANNPVKKEQEISDWYYMPAWKSSILNPANDPEPSGKYRWLVFVNDMSLSRQLVKKLKDNHQDVIMVGMGQSFRRDREDVYTVNPRQSQDYDLLFQQLLSSDHIPDQILHLWLYTRESDMGITDETLDANQAAGFYSMLYTAKALGKKDYAKDIHITVVSDYLHEITSEEPLSPGKAVILGLLKVIPQEYPAVSCKNIDILPPEPGSLKERELVNALWQELKYKTNEASIAYRGNRRWAQEFEPIHLPERGPELPSTLREQGVYLISGGLGTIGLIFSQLLVQLVGARLILTGRSEFPPKDEWNRYLENHDRENPLVIKIKKLQELENLGGTVLYYKVSSADITGMQKAVRQVEKTFGKINGVIHAAGIVEGESMRSIRDLTDNDCRQQFEAKVHGTIVLEEVFKNRDLDFCWMLSSISCVLGGLGFGAYASANLFMDVFVKKHNRTNRTRWFSLNWDGMDEKRSTAAFKRLFYINKPDQLVFSREGNLKGRIDKWVKLETLRNKKESSPHVPSFTGYKRPDLPTPYEPPRSPGEKSIAEIWQNLFGFDKIGIKDDFLELGGDSLKAITVISRIHQKLGVNIPVTVFFNQPTVEALAGYSSDQSGEDGYEFIEKAEEKEFYPVSLAQRRMYILQQMETTSTRYNMPYPLWVEGKLDRERVEKVFKKLVQRHESFRTSFEIIENDPVQKIREKVNFAVEYYDLEAPGQDHDTPNEIIANFIRPFDLARAPLFRVGVINDREKSFLIADMHHIISDGISLAIMLKDFMILYEGGELDSLRIQNRDFSEWQNQEKIKNRIKKQEEYWIKQFDGGVHQINLPIDYPRPAVPDFKGEQVFFEIGEQETKKLNEIAVNEKVTMFMLVLAIHNVLLARLTGEEDITVGVGVDIRKDEEQQKIIGMFINTLALRNYPRAGQTFREFLQQVKNTALPAFENQEYPFDELVEKLVPERNWSRNPMFDTFVMSQNMEMKLMDMPEVTGSNVLNIKPHKPESSSALFDIGLLYWVMKNEILLMINYSTQLFKKETIKKFTGYYQDIVTSVTENINVKLKDIRFTHSLLVVNPGSDGEENDDGDFHF